MKIEKFILIEKINENNIRELELKRDENEPLNLKETLIFNGREFLIYKPFYLLNKSKNLIIILSYSKSWIKKYIEKYKNEVTL